MASQWPAGQCLSSLGWTDSVKVAGSACHGSASSASCRRHLSSPLLSPHQQQPVSAGASWRHPPWGTAGHSRVQARDHVNITLRYHGLQHTTGLASGYTVHTPFLGIVFMTFLVLSLMIIFHHYGPQLLDTLFLLYYPETRLVLKK